MFCQAGFYFLLFFFCFFQALFSCTMLSFYSDSVVQIFHFYDLFLDLSYWVKYLGYCCKIFFNIFPLRINQIASILKVESCNIFWFYYLTIQMCNYLHFKSCSKTCYNTLGLYLWSSTQFFWLIENCCGKKNAFFLSCILISG